MNIKEEYQKGLVKPVDLEDTDYKFLRKVTPEEKPIKTNRGYSWYLCPCGEIVIKRNDNKPKVCNCNTNKKGQHYSFEQKKEIIEFYQKAPVTHELVCEKFNISEPTFEKILKQFKVKSWNKAQIFSPELDESFFQNIDTDEKAYFIGLFLTDGNVFDNYKSQNHQANVNLTLQDSDAYLLEEFKKLIGLNKKITSDGRGCSQIVVMSNQMAKDLSKYGIVPKKTFSARFPFSKIPKEFYHSVLRGIIDGDGSIGFYARPGRKVHSKTIRICSASFDFLQDIQQLLLQELEIKPNKIIREKENLWSIGYGSKEALLKIISWIYSNSKIHLNRKKEKCDLILDEIGKYRDN